MSGTLKLLQSINESGKLGLSEDRIEKYFTKWWPDLENRLQDAPLRPMQFDRVALIAIYSRKSCYCFVIHLAVVLCRHTSQEVRHRT